jgi:hypothetical protein
MNGFYIKATRISTEIFCELNEGFPGMVTKDN